MQNRHKNNLGLMGWLAGGRYGAERYAYAVHRLTGLGILAYFLMHIFVTGSRVGGPEQWDSAMAFFDSPVFKVGEFMVFLAFAYHALNGIRLIFVELGFLVGKPGLPSYPYNYSTLRQRPLFVAVMVIALVLMIIGGADFYTILMR
ncbi:MAG: succinate dehydrogenase, cytochrome b556 subunit [Acidobacteriota bacterium]|jgi:succinate dehydrogenase / fumarate reductase cytochrome b subunit|nr:succinate dehydrogenase, cytochrome b556 subunit [Acidobacteriota bacterium]